MLFNRIVFDVYFSPLSQDQKYLYKIKNTSFIYFKHIVLHNGNGILYLPLPNNDSSDTEVRLHTFLTRALDAYLLLAP